MISTGWLRLSTSAGPGAASFCDAGGASPSLRMNPADGRSGSELGPRCMVSVSLRGDTTGAPEPIPLFAAGPTTVTPRIIPDMPDEPSSAPE